MITKLHRDTLDCSPHLRYVKSPKLYRADTPVKILQLLGGSRELVEVELPDGKQITVGAGDVDSGINCPEESLSHLAKTMGINYNTLVRAVQEGRVLARKSGKMWLSTENAIEHARATGKIEPRK